MSLNFVHNTVLNEGNNKPNRNLIWYSTPNSIRTYTYLYSIVTHLQCCHDILCTAHNTSFVCDVGHGALNNVIVQVTGTYSS